MVKARFCPRCGSKKGPWIKGFCKNCFVASFASVVIPKGLSVKVCRDCGKMLVDGKWMLFSLDHLARWMERKSKVKGLSNVRWQWDGKLLDNQAVFAGFILGEAEGVVIEVPVEETIPLLSTLCSDCSKLSADYYESVLQLRLGGLPKKEWGSVLQFVRENVASFFVHDSLARITEVVNLPNGFDVFIGSKRAGKQVAERLANKWNGTITRSFSLAGVDKSGKPRKRYTFLVRI